MAQIDTSLLKFKLIQLIKLITESLLCVMLDTGDQRTAGPLPLTTSNMSQGRHFTTEMNF